MLINIARSTALGCLEALHAIQGWHIITWNCQKEQGASLSCQMFISKCYRNVLVWEQRKRKEEWRKKKKNQEGKLHNPELRRSLWLGVLQVGLAQKRPFTDCMHDQVLLWKSSLQWTSRTVTVECSETPKLPLNCSHDSQLSQLHHHVYYVWILWKVKPA